MKTKILEATKNGSGLNTIYSILTKNGYTYQKEVFNFGLHTNKQAQKDKEDFLNEQTDSNVVHLHYYSLAIKAKNGYTYNRIRGLKLTFEKKI